MSGYGKQFGRVPWGANAAAIQEVDLSDSLSLSESLLATGGVAVIETVTFGDFVTSAVSTGGYIIPEGGYQFEVILGGELNRVGATDPANFLLTSVTGTPVEVTSIEGSYDVLETGSDGEFVVDPDGANGWTVRFYTPSEPFSGALGSYLVVPGIPDPIRIRNVVSDTTVELEAHFLPDNVQDGSIEWQLISPFNALTFHTTKQTRGADYHLVSRNLRDKFLNPYRLDALFTSNAERPKLSPALTLLDEGTIIADFGEPMRADSALTDPAEYSISGPTLVKVNRVTLLDPNRIALFTSGLGTGSYQLTVNATGTPKDIAGNPIDPTFNQAIFSGSSPLIPRSIYTDKGPIAKPTLTVQSGTLATLDNFTDVTLPGAALIPDHVGLYVTLSGGIINGGTFRVLAVLSATKATLQASFTLPDPSSGLLNWALIDPRNGQIADDPADVTVKINNVPVTPDAVIGLLGQIVLASAPAPTDDVKVDYNWICNPVVDVRRLNSKEFRLNSWNRDVGYPHDPSQHHYRYNNTLVKPELYVPDDMQATLDQPLLRELHYRAYERAYTPVLNDPNLLLLNTPNHHIAYPPMQRQLAEQFIRYEALTLPETDPATPWLRKGTGIASVSAGLLTVQDNSTGVFPTGQPVFWVRGVDLSFPHAFAMAWRCQVTTIAALEGVFTGLAAGYSDELLSTIVGFLDDGGVKKIGFLRRGFTDDPSQLDSWVGSFDSFGNPTYNPVELDWTVLHSYRIYRDPLGVVRLYIDGSVTEIAKIYPQDRPFLEELNAPFDEIQDVFFGSVSRPAESTSKWDFVRYLSIPLNPQQIAPSSFTSYEANVVPELDTKPWTPVGFHGTETIISTDYLLLDSTSATDVPPTTVGLVGADFRGFVRLEPLLTAASEVVLDVGLDLRTHTFGISPNGLMAAVDNGDRLIQLCFFPDKAAPKKSYGGRSFPEDFSPYVWSSLGTATAEMAGRILRVLSDDRAGSNDGSYTIGGSTFTSVSHNFTAEGVIPGDTLVVYDPTPAVYTVNTVGTTTLTITGTFPATSSGLTYQVGGRKVYYIDDTAPSGDPARVVEVSNDYILEFRVKVTDYVLDSAGFAGVFGHVFDGTRAVGAMFTEILGTKYVSFCSDGDDLAPPVRFPFNWGDGQFHTYRLVKNTTFPNPPVISLFIDGQFIGATDYSNFVAPPPAPIGQISFGSTTPASAAALSDAYWAYCNVWRVLPDQRHYVGLWKGTDPNSLTGYHLPLKAFGDGAQVIGNSLTDVEADFFVQGVAGGDKLVVDDGPNKGVYEIAAVGTPTTLTIVGTWPSSPTSVDYRIPDQIDWTTQHKYRLLKSPTGDVNVLIDSNPVPIISTDYSSLTLPASSVGVVHTLTEGVAAIAFGSFEPTDLSQSSWDFVRYGITRSVTELRIVPHHEVLNQWNVMASPEHLRTSLSHTHTSFKSSSTGIPPKIDPDFLRDPALIAWTLLNEGTPLVPETQSFEVRGPYPVQEYVSALNRPEDVLNNDGDFTLNDGSIRYKLVVPDDVLYTSLDVIEQTTGTSSALLSPFCDTCGLLSLTLEYQKEVCLTYDGSTLPEDSGSPTPWELVSDTPSQVITSALAGILTYSTGVLGTRTVYRNNTPLPDAPGLQTIAKFKLKLLNDSTGGTGDSQVRFGLSAPGMTVGLAFVTTVLAERFVLAVDLNTHAILGSAAFDYLDGNFHEYTIIRDPAMNTLTVGIDL